jgi:hypothetical protein
MKQIPAKPKSNFLLTMVGDVDDDDDDDALLSVDTGTIVDIESPHVIGDKL